uniref:Toxin candidate TRINITY_DN13207_c0_g2_i1.p1 n=1 Tax=Pachycerianthus borealis TaxID=2736680 RepID=A0A7G7WYU4_9CNID|nr:toxin candidate TRINITY_DN13207_c0_g2_i1.p1 [Pachycerianthus borealis]
MIQIIALVFSLLLSQVEASLCQNCPNTWVSFDNHCYRINYWTATSWHTAQRRCMDYGADLASIRYPEEQEFVFEWVKRVNKMHHNKYYWIGLNDIEKEKKWRWIDGSTYYYKNWSGNQPNNAHGIQDCTVIGSQGTWSDFACKNKGYRYICKKKC